MIRGTINEGISTLAKQVADPTNNPGIAGEGFEVVDTAAGLDERRDIDVRVAGQTTTPSFAFNGTYE